MIETRWIPVSESLPDPYVEVIIWFIPDFPNDWEKEGMKFGSRGLVSLTKDNDYHWRPAGGHGNFDRNVTHWMPKLPKPE